MEFGNIGVFLCSCGKTLNLDFKKISKELEKLEEVAVVERVEHLCMEDGLAYIVDDLRRKELDKIVVAACTGKNKVFEDVAEQMGLDPMGVEVVNIREECAWVHKDKRSATQKAKVIVKSAVKKEARLPELANVEANPSILIAGDTRALALAEDFSELNIDLHILNERPYFKRSSVKWESYSPSSKGSFYELEDVTFHTKSKILEINGDLGDFTVEVEKGGYVDIVKCVDCGKCIEVCEQKAISRPTDSTTPVYVIGDMCNECAECIKVCPTNAIVLKPENETLNVGQIISFYPLEPREGVYIIDEKGEGSAARDAALRAALNIKGFKKEKFIVSNLDVCANKNIREKTLDLTGCTYCNDSCAYFPVRSGVVSDLACKGCGSCATSCPQNTFKLNNQSFDELLHEVDLTAEAEVKNKIVMFTCSEGGYSTLKAAGMNRLQYPPAMTIFVPCLGNVSELHILRAFDVGADGVVLLGCGGEKCMYEKGFARGSASAAMARKIIDFFNIGKERLRMLSADGSNPEKFTEQIQDFEERIKRLGKNPLSKKPADLESIDKKENRKRAIFHALITGFSDKTGVKEGRIKGELPVSYLTVNEKECTLCGSCAYHCNAGAFRHEGKEILDIYNTHTYCIGCGICEEIWPEDAISLERVLDISPFINKEDKKFNIKIINCSVCGKPLMAEAALKKLKSRLNEKELDIIQKCQGCLDKETVADILQVDPTDNFIVIQQGKAPWDS